jgi:hypothetical protein
MSRIVSNNQARPLFYYHDFNAFNGERETIRKEFSNLSDEEFESVGFFNYLGSWYTLADFIRLEGSLLAKGWQGYLSETAWSAVVVRIVDSCQSVIVGRHFVE